MNNKKILLGLFFTTYSLFSMENRIQIPRKNIYKVDQKQLLPQLEKSNSIQKDFVINKKKSFLQRMITQGSIKAMQLGVSYGTLLSVTLAHEIGHALAIGDLSNTHIYLGGNSVQKEALLTFGSLSFLGFNPRIGHIESSYNNFSPIQEALIALSGPSFGMTAALSWLSIINKKLAHNQLFNNYLVRYFLIKSFTDNLENLLPSVAQSDGWKLFSICNMPEPYFETIHSTGQALIIGTYLGIITFELLRKLIKNQRNISVRSCAEQVV